MFMYVWRLVSCGWVRYKSSYKTSMWAAAVTLMMMMMMCPPQYCQSEHCFITCFFTEMRKRENAAEKHNINMQSGGISIPAYQDKPTSAGMGGEWRKDMASSHRILQHTCETDMNFTHGTDSKTLIFKTCTFTHNLNFHFFMLNIYAHQTENINQIQAQN